MKLQTLTKIGSWILLSSGLFPVQGFAKAAPEPKPTVRLTPEGGIQLNEKGEESGFYIDSKGNIRLIEIDVDPVRKTTSKLDEERP